MALLSRPLVIDGVTWGTAYTFESAGDIFPVHVHTENDNHITIIAHGSVRLTGHPRYEGEVVTAQPGAPILNWKAGEPHGFVALTDGATLVNLLKKR